MLINIEVNNNVEIRSLNDLFILGRLQEVGSIKVNKSEMHSIKVYTIQKIIKSESTHQDLFVQKYTKLDYVTSLLSQTCLLD